MFTKTTYPTFKITRSKKGRFITLQLNNLIKIILRSIKINKKCSYINGILATKLQKLNVLDAQIDDNLRKILFFCFIK